MFKGKKLKRYYKEYLVMQINFYKKHIEELITATTNKTIFQDSVHLIKGKIIGAAEVLHLRVEFKDKSSDVYIYDKNDNIVIDNLTIRK